MAVAKARNNDVEIAHETFGVPGDETVLLSPGLGAQILIWPDDVCETLADRGYFVARARELGLI